MVAQSFAVRPDDLSRFLDEVDLLSHNRPNIAPARNAVAHVAAELYDGGYIREADWELVGFDFREL